MDEPDVRAVVGAVPLPCKVTRLFAHFQVTVRGETMQDDVQESRRPHPTPTHLSLPADNKYFNATHESDPSARSLSSCQPGREALLWFLSLQTLRGNIYTVFYFP